MLVTKHNMKLSEVTGKKKVVMLDFRVNVYAQRIIFTYRDDLK